jgi:hypothetical protein
MGCPLQSTLRQRAEVWWEVGDGWDVCVPISLAATLLLGAGGSVVDVARLAKVPGQVLGGSSGAVGEADVVAVGGFVGASHCEGGVSLIGGSVVR